MAAERAQMFADLLRAARRAAGLTQEELAERAALSVRALRKLESGASQMPRRDTVALLAAALGLGATEQAAFARAARRSLSHPGTQAGQLAASEAALSLVGRVSEVARLGRHLAGDGPPLLLLAGEPGIGKTRLLQETATRAHEAGWTVLAGGCTRRSGQEPYAPLLGALARFLAARTKAQLRTDLEGCTWLVRLLPELAERAVVPVPGWTLPPEQERRLMFAAVERVLANVAGRAGILLVLDDLQWAGSDALDLLASLVHTASVVASPRPLRLLGVYRATEVPTTHPLAALRAELGRQDLLAEARLGPLAPEEARQLLAILLADADAAERKRLTATLLARAGGVPFFLVSCAREAAAGGMEDGEVPWTVQQSLRQRVAALPTAAQTLLGLAAVAGRELPRPVLLAAAEDALAADRATLLGAIEAACEVGLLAEDERGDYRFAHDLIREAALADLSAARQATWHRVWAEALERRPEGERAERAAELAWHFVRADEPARALRYTLAAGDRAQALFAQAEAESYFREAVEQLDGLGHIEEAAQAREKLAATLIAQTRYDEALHVLERAAQLHRDVGNREGFWQATAQMGWVHAARGMPQEGMAYLQSMDASQSEQEPAHGRALLRVALAHLYLHAGRFGQAVTAAEQAAELSRAAEDQRLLTQAETTRGTALLYQGFAVAARQVLEGALILAEAAGDIPDLVGALENVGDASRFLGEFVTCKRYAERALSIAEQLGDLSAVASAIFRHGLISYFLGDWAQGRQDFEQAMRMIGQANDSWLWIPLSLHLGELDLAEGRREASQHLEEVIDLLEHKGEHAALPHAHSVLAERDVLEGRPEAALARLEPLRQVPGLTAHVGATEMLSLLAWAHLSLGDEVQAEALLMQCLQPAIAERYRPAQVGALQVRATVAVRQRDWKAGEVALDEALALCRAMPYPYAEAKALYTYGQLHTAKGETEQGREQYEAALAICRRLGEGMYRPIIERALAQLGAAPS